MSERSPQQPETSFDTSRLRIELHRRLINDDIRERTGVMEYADMKSGKRILTIPRLSKQVAIHDSLQQKRVPVYPILGRDSRNVLLNIPNDARTIQGSLKFIARDVIHYSEIFTQIGETLGRCAVSGLGLPEPQLSRSVLGGIAFSLNEDETFGGNVHLLPPYALSLELDKAQELNVIRNELQGSGYIKHPVADELIRAASSGWESVRI